jgi:hypothetical protein
MDQDRGDDTATPEPDKILLYLTRPVYSYWANDGDLKLHSLAQQNERSLFFLSPGQNMQFLYLSFLLFRLNYNSLSSGHHYPLQSLNSMIHFFNVLPMHCK